MRSIKSAIIVTIAAVLALSCMLCTFCTSCTKKTPKAVLHAESDIGYVSYSPKQLKVSISSPQAFVYDLNADEIIYIKGEDTVVYPASITKLCTILYSLTILSPDDLITPGDEVKLIAADSSTAYIKKHHTLSVEMLIEGMLLPSGNDAAYAIAGAVGRRLADDATLSPDKAIARFVDGMNEYANSLGCVGSNFTVPDGYDTENNYSTLEDMILIGRAAAKNDIIMKYACMNSDNVTYASGHTNTWTNTNVMLDESSEYYCSYITGLKTGSLSGRYHFISTFEQGDRHYLIGVFGSDKKEVRFADTLTICNLLEKTGEQQENA